MDVSDEGRRALFRWRFLLAVAMGDVVIDQRGRVLGGSVAGRIDMLGCRAPEGLRQREVGGHLYPAELAEACDQRLYLLNRATQVARPPHPAAELWLGEVRRLETDDPLWEAWLLVAGVRPTVVFRSSDDESTRAAVAQLGFADLVTVEVGDTGVRLTSCVRQPG